MIGWTIFLLALVFTSIRSYWLTKTGIIGAIARDVLKKYAAIKSSYPDETGSQVTNGVWELWLSLNEPRIRAKDGRAKNTRLDVRKVERRTFPLKDHLFTEDLLLMRLFADVV